MSLQEHTSRDLTRKYLVEDLTEHVALKALISGVREKTLWKYTLPNRRLLKVKQNMESYIRVDEVSMLRHDLPCFTRDKQP